MIRIIRISSKSDFLIEWILTVFASDKFDSFQYVNVKILNGVVDFEIGKINWDVKLLTCIEFCSFCFV